MKQLTFKQLREANATRGIEWTGHQGGLEEIELRTLELGGETSEVQNDVKKLVRHLRGWKGGVSLEASRKRIAEELADVIICADRVAEVLEIDLDEAVVDKFNKTSAKQDLKTQLVAEEGLSTSEIECVITAVVRDIKRGEVSIPLRTLTNLLKEVEAS